MRTGRYVERSTDLAIGTEQGDTAGIALVRLEAAPQSGRENPFGNMTHMWDISLQIKAGARPSGLSRDLVYDVAWVNFDGRTASFERVAPGYGYNPSPKYSFDELELVEDPVTGSNTYKYRSADYVEIEFRPFVRGSTGKDCSAWSICALASKVTYPDGTVYTFEYDTRSSGGNTARLKRVASNRGYALKFEYAGQEWNLVTRACVVSKSEVVESVSSSCPVGPGTSVDYNYASFQGRYMLNEVARSATEVFDHDYAAISGGNGDRFTMSYRKPGDTSPWLVNSIEPTRNTEFLKDDVVFRQDFATGEFYTYAYDLTPLETHASLSVRQVIAGGQYTDSLGNTTKVQYDFPPFPYSFTERFPESYQSNLYRFIYDYDGLDAVVYADPGTVPNDPDDIPHIVMYLSGPQVIYALELATIDSCYECSGSSGSFYSVSHQISPGPAYIEDPLGNVTTFDHCDPDWEFPEFEPYQCTYLGRYTKRTGPEGDIQEYRYNFGRLVEVTSHPDTSGEEAPLEKKLAYGCGASVCRMKPTQITDAKDIDTDYTYDSTHGGVLTETLPAGTNGIRPQKRYTYTQQYAWVKSGAGFVQATDPVWLLASEEFCKTTAASGSGCAGGASDEVVTTYEYEQGNASTGSNLLLLGVAVTADGQTLRTCYEYDNRGRKISETAPAADLSSCS